MELETLWGGMAKGSQEERSCPVDGCDNPELDEISDMDDQTLGTISLGTHGE